MWKKVSVRKDKREEEEERGGGGSFIFICLS